MRIGISEGLIKVLLMKLCKYVFDVRNGEEHLLINLINGIAVIISNQNYVNLINGYREGIDQEVWDVLVQKQFLVQNEDDELNFPYGKYTAINMNITNICNFSCHYCYFRANNKEKEAMAVDADEFLKWVKVYVMPKQKDIFINYLGGEPLIESEKLIHISRNMQKLVENSSMRYFGEVTTNGYFLSPHLARVLFSAGIRCIQITLDGNREEHNRIRNCHGVNGTYDKIISNICACNAIIPIIFRININKKTDVIAIYDLLKDLKAKGIENIYFSAIEDNYLGDSDSAEDNEYALSDAEAIDKYIKVWMLQKSMGFRFIQKIPSIVGNCIAKNPNGYTINYDGKIYLCPSTCGISRFYIDDLYNFKSKEKKSQIKKEDCKTCALYPVCMGGCDIIRSIGQKEDACRKTYISQILTNYFRIKYL